MGPVYDGMGHLLLTPEDLVPVLALALYAGLRGARSGRWVLFLLPGAWLIGGLAGSALGDAPPWPLAAVSFLVLGALVAADLRLPSPVVAGLAVVMGLIHGFLNGAALNPGPGFPGLLGIAALLFVIVALVAAFVLSLKHAWTRIAVRVAGSWIFASGLLLVGWFVRAHR
jgi:hydrogenase/urease accessory protein HupE